MKPLTPFQKALLDSTVSQFDRVPEEENVDISPSSQFTCEAQRIAKKPHFRKMLRRSLLVASVLLLLVGTAVATYLLPGLGEVEVDTYSTVMPDGNAFTHFKVRFKETFNSVNAPDSIEVYSLPTLDVSIDNVHPYNTIIQSHTVGYFPFLSEGSPFPDNVEPTDPIQNIQVEWFVNGRFVRYAQRTAKSFFINEDSTEDCMQDTSILSNSLHHWIIPNELTPEMTSELLTIDDKEVLSVSIVAENRTWHSFFWTDGDYLYHINATNVDRDYMTELLRSVQPMEDMSPYLDPVDKSW